MVEMIFTINEVSKHNTPNDAWIIFEGGVYDITLFIPLHPGGAILNDFLGQDVKNVWIGQGYTRHLRDNNVFQILQNYKIGKLAENFTNIKSNNTNIIIVLVIIILLIIYYFVIKK